MRRAEQDQPQVTATGRHARWTAVLAVAVLLGGVGVLVAWSVSTHGTAQVEACQARASFAVLPEWASGGFSDPKIRIAHEFSASGKLVAILWANPLLSPPAKDHNNKILWVSRVPGNGSDLRISAQRMIGSTRVGSPVARRVFGGPGPSIINLPAAGCWRLALRWSRQLDTIDLVYAANKKR